MRTLDYVINRTEDYDVRDIATNEDYTRKLGREINLGLATWLTTLYFMDDTFAPENLLEKSLYSATIVLAVDMGVRLFGRRFSGRDTFPGLVGLVRDAYQRVIQ